MQQFTEKLNKQFYKGGFDREDQRADDSMDIIFAPIVAEMIRAVTSLLQVARLDEKGPPNFVFDVSVVRIKLLAAWSDIPARDLGWQEVELLYESVVALVRRFTEDRE